MPERGLDKFWRGAAIGCGAELAPWLRDRGSLTQRIRLRCRHFQVRCVRDGPARIAFDEAALLGVAPRQLAWSREVLLVADGRPVVFAHSALAREQLHGAWSALRTLGSRPLGGYLFAHPRVERKPLRYQALPGTHPLYLRAAAALPDPPGRLWARRSLFYLGSSPLLVTEVFLPSILSLARPA